MGNKATSIDKVLDILFLFTDHSELTAQEISDILHSATSTTYKYLDILYKRGLLGKSIGGKSYILGHMTYKLGSRFIEGDGLLNIAVPHMESLANKCKETIILTVISGWEGLVVADIQPSQPYKLSVGLNTRAPLHAGAAQKVLLAYQNDAFIADFISISGLPSLTPNTVTDADLLTSQLQEIRKAGYAIADSEVQTWLEAIAVPVFDHQKKIIASLASVSPRAPLSIKKSETLINMLKECSAKISHGLSVDDI